MDLSSTKFVVLTPELAPQAIPTGVFGPLPEGTVGILLGRSSLTMKGLQVLPGVIDNDYQGEIKVMCSAPRNIITIQPKDRIAQLVLLPLVKVGRALQPKRGTGSFGSSDAAFWVQSISHDRPLKTLTLNGKAFRGILDTGADVSVISLDYWPKNWPVTVAVTELQGIGQTNSPLRSTLPLKWRDDEGHSGEIQPYVLPKIPANLWGRDILQQMGVMMFTQDQLPFL